MHKGNRKMSMQKGFIVISILLVCLIIVELAYVMSASYSLFDRYRQTSGQSVLMMYSQFLDSKLKTMSSYMNRMMTDHDDLKLLGVVSDARTRFNARRGVSELLSTLLQLEPLADGGVCWVGEEVVAVNSSDQMTVNANIQKAIITLAMEPDTLFVNSGWNWVRIADRWYLVNITHYQSTFCAVWLGESMIASYAENHQANGNFGLFCTQEQQVIGYDTEQLAEQRPSNILEQESREGNFSYCCLAVEMPGQVTELFFFIVMICVVMAVTVFVSISVLRYLLNRMLREVREGLVMKGRDLSRPLANSASMIETDTVFKTLDDMSEKIQNLQNNVYLHEINEQKSRLQALHMQINSHFFGNCMNIIFSLAEVKKNELIQDFCIYLIDYLNYIGTAFKPSTSLANELVHLESYLTLQKMRYPERVRWEIDVQQEARDIQVLPLLLLTFIENIFKHALIAEQPCFIRIQAFCSDDDEQQGLHILIEDDGSGIDEGLAASLNAFDFSRRQMFDQKSGIEKTLARIQLFYGEKATFHIGNKENNTGTVIRLYFPQSSILEKR